MVASLALVIAGALGVVYFSVVLAVQVAVLFQTRSWMAPDLIAWLCGVAGLLAAGLGAWGVLAQQAAIRGARQREQDRLRRVRDYRRDAHGVETPDGRREPYIGRDANRRVA